MMPTQPPAATPAPIHDIAGPVWFFPYPLWMVFAAVAGLLVILGLIIWLVRRARRARALTPKQRALAALTELGREGGEADPYAFGIRVSDALSKRTSGTNTGLMPSPARRWNFWPRCVTTRSSPKMKKPRWRNFWSRQTCSNTPGYPPVPRKSKPCSPSPSDWCVASRPPLFL